MLAGDDELHAWLFERLSARGYGVHRAASALAFQRLWKPVQPHVTLCDLEDPPGDGLRTLEWLQTRGNEGGVLGMCRTGCVRATVEAMRLGALDVLELPLDEEELLAATEGALRAPRPPSALPAERLRAQERLTRLTRREREVLDLVTRGQTSRQIALRLGLSKRTVDVHRRNFLRKLEGPSIMDLLRLYARP